MSAFRGRSGAVALLAIVVVVGPAIADGDPQSLLLDVREQLDRGDVEGAAASARALRVLLDADPRWDPDGLFRSRLLPAAEAGIDRLRAATRALEALPDRAGESRSDPRPAEDPTDLTPYFAWGGERTERLRTDLQSIAQRLPAGRERGALLQSESYTRASAQAEVQIQPSVRNALQARVAELLEGDERVRALKTRLEALKREVVASAVEHQRLEELLDAAAKRERTYKQQLFEFIGCARRALPDPDSPQPADFVEALALRIQDRFAELRSLESQTPTAKAQRMAEIERFRLANRINVSDGGRNLFGRIEALAAAIDSVPLGEQAPGGPSFARLTCCLSACRE